MQSQNSHILPTAAVLIMAGLIKTGHKYDPRMRCGGRQNPNIRKLMRFVETPQPIVSCETVWSMTWIYDSDDVGFTFITISLALILVCNCARM